MDWSNKLKDSFLQFFHDLFDLMVVNWLWLLCSLPIVTVGPATCGLYRVTLKLARQEPVQPLKDFFRGFRENFKSGLFLGLWAILLLVAALGDLWLLLQLTGWMQGVYIGAAVLIGLMFLTVVSYAFALAAMFDNPLKAHTFNAFKLALVFPLRTVLLWLILLIPVLAAVLLPVVALKMLGFLYLVAGISGPVYGASHILRNIFDCVNGASTETALPTSED